MKVLKIPIFIFLAYVILGVATIKDYGINWDEPAHFMRGQAFLRFFLTGKKDYGGLPELDLKHYKKDWGYEFLDPKTGNITRRSIYQHEGQEFMYYTEDIEKRGSHPAFSDLMAALFNYVFFIKLGIAPDVFSYNYYVIVVASLLLFGTYVWARNHFGNFAAFVSVLSLGLFPAFWAELHNNVKDIPEAVFYSFTAFVFYDAVTTKRLKYAWYFVLWASLAFATKFNIFFLFLTLFLWLVFRYLFFFRKLPIRIGPFIREHRKFLLIFFLVPVGMFTLWVVTFPATWFQPKLLLASFKYYKTIGTTPVGNDWHYPLYYLFYTTYPLVLFLSTIGIVSLFSRVNRKTRDALLFVVLWFLIPIIRVMVPGAAIYGGVRQIMEFIPALTLLTGIGAQTLTSWVRRKGLVWERLSKIAIVVSFLPLLITLIRIHPNEGVYFNSIIGGLKGAKENNIPDWGQTLGNPHRQGITWINNNVEYGSKLSLGFEYWANLPHIWVRNDINYLSQLKSGPSQLGEYVMSVVNPSEYLDWYRMRYLEEFLNPVYEVKVDGVPLLKIWKNDPQHLKEQYKNMQEERMNDVPLTRQGLSFTLTLPRTRRLLRLEFKNENPRACDELNDYVGNIQIYKDLFLTRPKAVRATAYDFNKNVTYKKPFFLFAAEEARIIVVNIAIDHPCYNTIFGADIVVVKE